MAWGSLALSVHDGATDMHNRKVNVQLLHEVILVDIFTRRLYVNSCKAYTLISGHPGGGGGDPEEPPVIFTTRITNPPSQNQYCLTKAPTAPPLGAKQCALPSQRYNISKEFYLL